MSLSVAEIWKDAFGYEGLYQVSNLGRVKSLERYKKNGKNSLQLIPEYFKTTKQNNKTGYVQVDLYKNNKRKNWNLHRLILSTFKGYSKLDVNHINGIKTDNRLENLEYCTRKENMKHAWDNGLCENVRRQSKIQAQKLNFIRWGFICH